MTDCVLGTSPKTAPSMMSTAAESSVASYSPAASQTALISPPPHTAAPVIVRDYSNFLGASSRPGVVGAVSTPAYPQYNAHEDKLHSDDHHHQQQQRENNAKHVHGQASSSSSTFNAAKMVRNLSGGHKAKEADHHMPGHTPVAVLHVPVLTRDGRLYGWNIVLPPSDTKPLPSADRKIFFVPASEEISKDNMKAIHSVENDKEGRMKLYCRKTWMLDNYVVEARIPGT